jgi:hypothetical protein
MDLRCTSDLKFCKRCGGHILPNFQWQIRPKPVWPIGTVIVKAPSSFKTSLNKYQK